MESAGEFSGGSVLRETVHTAAPFNPEEIKPETLNEGLIFSFTLYFEKYFPFLKSYQYEVQKDPLQKVRGGIRKEGILVRSMQSRKSLGVSHGSSAKLVLEILGERRGLRILKTLLLRML